LTRSKKISGKEEERLMMHQMQALAQKQVNPYIIHTSPIFTSIARTPCSTSKRAFYHPFSVSSRLFILFFFFQKKKKKIEDDSQFFIVSSVKFVVCLV